MTHMAAGWAGLLRMKVDKIIKHETKLLSLWGARREKARWLGSRPNTGLKAVVRRVRIVGSWRCGRDYGRASV